MCGGVMCGLPARSGLPARKKAEVDYALIPVSTYFRYFVCAEEGCVVCRGEVLACTHKDVTARTNNVLGKEDFRQLPLYLWGSRLITLGTIVWLSHPCLREIDLAEDREVDPPRRRKIGSSRPEGCECRVVRDCLGQCADPVINGHNQGRSAADPGRDPDGEGRG